jgi:predicted acyltransferase
MNSMHTPLLNPLASSHPPVSSRLASIDAYRGLVMFLMMAEVLALSKVAEALPLSRFWAFLAHHQSHVAWVGCSLHDLIQPSFSFLVGVAVPFSLASRRSKGQSPDQMLLHAAWRSLVLIGLGIFLRSIGQSQTNFTFEDTLTQIGLGYFFLFLLGWASVRVQALVLGGLLIAYWLAFALYPLPGPGFDWATAGVASDWSHHLSGFASHWNKNTNFAWAFDNWFLNLFPRTKPFLYNGGGYSTLSFIPTLATMILGLLAGGWLKSELSDSQKSRRLVWAGLVGLGAGLLLQWLGICPVVKRIWTPSWTLFSGGWCFLILAAFYAIADRGQARTWAFPLIVIGMNSIAIYSMDWLFVGFIRNALNTHLGADTFRCLGPAYETVLRGLGILLVLWLILFWMYRRKLFLKI